MKTPQPLHESVGPVEDISPIKDLLAELRLGLKRYWQTAHDILEENGVQLKKVSEESFSYDRNFFSLLFLYSFYRAAIPPQRRIFYSATLQCLRGMVTGCDNLLDDEYKVTLDTNIPEKGHRFRSVVDIMISDRVLFQLLLDEYQKGDIPYEKIHQASTISMKSMMKSGIQEASEESGVTEILPPDTVLKTIHHLKTGILFTCPWDIPLILEQINRNDISKLTEGLYLTGIGCQILDDMVDFFSDISSRRHNYLVSLIHHGDSATERKQYEQIRKAIITDSDSSTSPSVVTNYFPAATMSAAAASYDYLEKGLSQLFAEDHSFLVTPAIAFLQKRIAGPLSLKVS